MEVDGRRSPKRRSSGRSSAKRRKHSMTTSKLELPFIITKRKRMIR